jgi:beta-glucosidase
LIDAHRCATEAIKAERDSLPVGWTIAADLFVAEQGGEELMDEFRRESIDFFLEASQKDDILGLQAYTKLRIGPNGVQVPPPEAELTESYGWEYYPDALEQSIRYVHTKTNLPILVTENGLATGDDSRRIEWIAHTVKGLKKCLEDGLDVRGYLYWSAMDNFEWEAGYSPRFGIIAVDRDTQKRTIKESAKFLGNIAKTNAIDT